jgi:hypothetical protein
MLTFLTEVYEEDRQFFAREVLVNPDHINFAREDSNIMKRLKETGSLKDLDDRAKFTRLFINRGNMGQEILVVGYIEVIFKKFSKASKTLLKD